VFLKSLIPTISNIENIIFIDIFDVFHFVLKRSGSWILTDMKAWYDGIRKFKVNSKNLYHGIAPNTWAISSHWLDKEYLEVFIDEKV
jgi:hypothetical protein